MARQPVGLYHQILVEFRITKGCYYVKLVFSAAKKSLSQLLWTIVVNKHTHVSASKQLAESSVVMTSGQGPRI
jgi:hypothetical protein